MVAMGLLTFSPHTVLLCRSVSKTMSSIEGQLVENARTSAQFSERLSRLESIPSPTSPARSADAPQATDEDLEEELIRAKLLVRRLEVRYRHS